MTRERMQAWTIMALIGAFALGPPSRVTAAGRSLEIFTYWTAGGEADGLAAIEKVFAAEHPDVTITNAVVAGGAGSNANAVLATRMQGGKPPDTFQIHGGAELVETWVKTGFMEPLGALYQEQGLNEKSPSSSSPS